MVIDDAVYFRCRMYSFSIYPSTRPIRNGEAGLLCLGKMTDIAGHHDVIGNEYQGNWESYASIIELNATRWFFRIVKWRGSLLLTRRNTRVVSIVAVVPIRAVGVSLASEAGAHVIVVSSIHEMPSVITSRTVAGATTAVRCSPAFCVGSLDATVRIDNVAAVAVIHPVSVGYFLPVAAEAVLAEVGALVSSTATEADAVTRGGEAPIGPPAVVTAGAITVHMNTSILGGIAGVVRARVAVVAIQKTLGAARSVGTLIARRTDISIVAVQSIVDVHAALRRIA
jgi:hypothetical protein